jgi:broad specificity phosphatase PhoE
MTGRAAPIVFVRHGETDWNRQGLIQGSIETDLNATGHAQAKAVAALLAVRKSAWAEFDIVVSPQARARQTASYILEALGRSDHRIDERVRELAFGVWEGRPFWELKDSPVYPADTEGRYFWRPEGGESYEDGVARVNGWRAGIVRPTIVVSHGAVGRCLIGAVSGLGPHDLVGLKTPQGAYCHLDRGQASWIDAAG